MPCYTCERGGRIDDLVIKEFELGFVSFDLIGRPVYIYTPHRHYESVAEVPAEEFKSFFLEMEDFLDAEGYRGSQVSRNRGSWMTHKGRHLHWKLHVEEETVYKKKREHLDGIRGSSRPRSA